MCDDAKKEALKHFGVAVALMLYLAVMVGTIVMSPNRKKDHSVLLRIITNYMQELLLVFSLNLNWPQTVLTIFERVSFATNSGTSFIRINCLLMGCKPLQFFLHYYR